MNDSVHHDRTRELAIAFAGGAALLCASLANFLNYNSYPLLRPEVGIVLLGLLAVAAAMAPIYVGQRRWGRSFLEGLLVTLFIDLNADSLLLAFAVGGMVAIVTWWRRISLLGPMAVLGAVILLTTLLGLGGRPAWIKVERGAQPSPTNAAAGHKPAILHLILDEHTGIEGLPIEGVEGRRLSDELRSFYVDAGFATYGGAYSRHYNTVNAVPDILNYGEKLGRSASKKGVQIGPTEHLESFVNQGYRLTIFQSDFADYCTGARFQECVTYDSSSLRPTLAVPMEATERARVIGAKYLRLSDLAFGASEKWTLIAAVLRQSGVPVGPYKVASVSSTAGAFEMMNPLTERIKAMRPGDAIFAHVLVPHFPYVVGSNCAYLPWSEWILMKGRGTFDARRQAYYSQVRCMTRRVGTMLEALSKTPGGRDAVVIIHGDHGSRIIRVNPNQGSFGKFGDSDMIAGFSTLFAVRAPQVPPSYFPERQPVATLLHDFAKSGFRAAPEPKTPQVPSVYLADERDWTPARRVALAPSWVPARTNSPPKNGAAR